MKTKKIWQSWTFWFNLITVILGALDVLTQQGILSPTVYAIILAIGNIVLRVFKTDTGIET